MKRCLRIVLTLAITLLPLAAAAEDLRPDAERYEDPDPAATYPRPAPGNRAQFRQYLNAQLRKNPDNPIPLVQRAYLHARGGQHEAAARDYDHAIRVTAPDSEQRRNVFWSRGWMRYENSDAAAALDDWTQALRLHGGHPGWSSYTLALAYWTLGKRELAFAWYDKAVQVDGKWRDAATLEDNIRYWRDPQNAAIRALQAAWRDDRYRSSP